MVLRKSFMTNIYQIRAAIQHGKQRHPRGFPKMWWLYKVNNSATVDVILVIHTVQIWEGMRLPESRSFCSKLENVLLSGPSSISLLYFTYDTWQRRMYQTLQPQYWYTMKWWAFLWDIITSILIINTNNIQKDIWHKKQSNP